MATVSTQGELMVHKGPATPASPSPRSSANRGQAVGSKNGQTVTLPDIRKNDQVVDRQKPLPTSLQSDFIPEDLLLALTYPAPPNDKLVPPNRYRNLNTTAALSRKAPANVWNYPKRREKLKHLTTETPCVCGAGKDISFLYDIPKPDEKEPAPGLYDASAARVETDVDEPRQALTLPDTLIPEEYHIVKNKGVMGLEYHEEKFSTQADDHEKHLVQFPSMYPTSRFEVLQLQATLEEMLEKIGINDLDIELKGPTQMHNLLELIKKEQNIYNVVFHELIRQVSVECLERGQLLSDLREKYSSILNKVPRQIKGLHEEVLAQRALDRRLTEELMRFKTTISFLTSELTSVKEHDQEVTRQANQAQDDLKSALAESRKNAGLLAEYHELYELQRKRLEKQVTMLSDEKEIWSTAAYSLALKVMEEHSLNTAKRLHVSNKAWCKLANHFTILLSDKDTETLTKLQGFVDRWRDLVEEFNVNTKDREAEMMRQLKSVRSGMQSWIQDFNKNYLSKDGHLMKQPDKNKVAQLYADVKAWEEMMSQESEKFGGDTVLSGQEFISNIRLQMFGWTDCAMKIFSRHHTEQGKEHPDQADMLKMNEKIELLLGQFSVRLTGENGVATGVIHISNMLESWDTKINTILHGSNPMPDQDWLRLYQLFDDWSLSLEDTMSVIGSTIKEDAINDKDTPRHIELMDVMKMCHKWLSSTTNGIDSEDAKLVEAVGGLHTDMVKWMVQMLLRIAPDQKEHSNEAKEAVLLGSATLGQLQASAKSLFTQLSSFTSHVSQCCRTIVTDDMQHKLDLRAENPDQEYNALKKLGEECQEWIGVAKMMLTELTGETFAESPSNSSTDMSREHTTTERPPEGVAFHDKEKLQTEEEQNAETQDETAAATTDETAEVSEPSKEVESEKEITAETDVKETEKISAKKEESQQSTEITNQDADEKESEKVEDEEDSSEVAPAAEPADPPPEQLEVIGSDANTHKSMVDQSANDPPPHEPLVKPEDLPPTPNTKQAYEALAAMETLQAQLMATEERAQTYEERASTAEAALKAANEKIRALQRQYGAPEDEKPKSAAEAPAQPVVDTAEVKDAIKNKDLSREKSKEKTTSRSSSRTSTKSKKK